MVDFAESFRELGVIIVSFLVAAVLLVAALWLRADDELDDVAFLGIVVLAGLLLLSAVGLSLINAKMLEKQNLLVTQHYIDTITPSRKDT